MLAILTPAARFAIKWGHTAANCWYRYDEDFVPDNCMAGMASTSTNDPNRYLDLGATDHITRELEKLTMHDTYHGNDQVWATNDTGIDIIHVSKTIMSHPTHPFHLNDVLHVPHTHKQLVSIHRFNLDNNAFIELHPFFFMIKDRTTRKVLLHGPCRGGMYPLPQLPQSTQKLLHLAIKPSSQRWHYKLGHPSRDIVHRVLRSNNISCSRLDSDESICDACLRAKAHQLPYSRSVSQSTTPLHLVFSVV
jgi:hypothetical protein